MTNTFRCNGRNEELIRNPPDLRLDMTVPFRQGWAGLVPRKPGVYLIHDLRGVLYVGRSVDLRRRFDDHYWIGQNPLLRVAVANPLGRLQYSWNRIDPPAQEQLEKELVRAFRPPCNRVLYANFRNSN